MSAVNLLDRVGDGDGALLQLFRREAADARALLVEQEDARKVPRYVSGERLLGKLPDGVRVGSVDLHLVHQIAAVTIEWQILRDLETGEERGDLLRRKFLPTKLVRGEAQYLQLWPEVCIPRSQLLIRLPGCASARRNIHHEHRRSREILHRQTRAVNLVCGEVVERAH